MPQSSNNISADLRGAGKLAISAITGVTDIVESLHHTISPVSGFPSAGDRKRTRGITGLVYRSIRTITGLVGDGIDLLLGQFSSIPGAVDSSPAREATVAALNGVIGDHLAASSNPLAISMQFRRNGKPVNERALDEAIRQCNGRLAIMVHGSCMNDLQWNRKGHDHGAALARELGILPVYVHYNTGLHISENGRNFASLLETIFNQSPHPPELFIIAHSMGGLVSRSACHYGKLSGHCWLDHLQKLIFLGTPHHGAPLEKGGNWINILMDTNPYSSPFSRLGKTRSCGITDLRYGSVLEDDWNGRCRFEFSGDQRKPVPLPDGVQCYSIAASTGKEPGRLGDDLIGDGLVPLSSALGRHKNEELNLDFPTSHQWVGRDMHHMDLLNHPEVYATIEQWLKPQNPN
jgi:pimeloyl-ACP methyl ester carboxylesterase